MRHGTSNNNRRQRNRGGNGGGHGRRNNQPRTQVYDSNGPDVRIRGTAHQVAEKYLALAKDAVSAGNHMVAENYFQHAEHYIRVINEFNGGFDAKKVTGERSPNEMKENEGNEKSSAKAESKEKVEDLSLPASILGGSVADAKSSTEVETVE
ncbi:MAG: DUF4167 domain-containing protein [Alphaproteobacteria bacterium]